MKTRSVTTTKTNNFWIILKIMKQIAQRAFRITESHTPPEWLRQRTIDRQLLYGRRDPIVATSSHEMLIKLQQYLHIRWPLINRSMLIIARPNCESLIDRVRSLQHYYAETIAESDKSSAEFHQATSSSHNNNNLLAAPLDQADSADGCLSVCGSGWVFLGSI